ncbi:hypothetical protein F5888DRAFT_1634142 [Russula emetica]|nr:hypothetical protein F5888DRAFT_1634142 [Russula emetica]
MRAAAVAPLPDPAARPGSSSFVAATATITCTLHSLCTQEKLSQLNSIGFLPPIESKQVRNQDQPAKNQDTKHKAPEPHGRKETVDRLFAVNYHNPFPPLTRSTTCMARATVIVAPQIL